MYQLSKTLGWKRILSGEAVPFVSALFIAETFYKLGSFIFECMAFLVTWYLISLALHWAAASFRRKRR